MNENRFTLIFKSNKKVVSIKEANTIEEINDLQGREIKKNMNIDCVNVYENTKVRKRLAKEAKKIGAELAY